jgi:hypothetical protein
MASWLNIQLNGLENSTEEYDALTEIIEVQSYPIVKAFLIATELE